jgi:hypothetical protein
VFAAKTDLGVCRKSTAWGEERGKRKETTRRVAYEEQVVTVLTERITAVGPVEDAERVAVLRRQPSGSAKDRSGTVRGPKAEKDKAAATPAQQAQKNTSLLETD